ncbi:hypothetical protein BAY59_27700 [Prauserella coralliicola]|nr:hypothetical protein BAY59_27700 [Prauserella coralliicola]
MLRQFGGLFEQADVRHPLMIADEWRGEQLSTTMQLADPRNCSCAPFNKHVSSPLPVATVPFGSVRRS